MNDNIIDVELHCAHCASETLHELVYAGRLLVSSKCKKCGTQVKHESNDLRFQYIKDLENRIATKPLRLWRQFWRSPATLLKSLPRKTLQQPKKIWDEITRLWR